MAGWFNLNYLKEPTNSKGVGIGSGIAAIGDSFFKLGAIGANAKSIDDEKEQRQKEYDLSLDRLNTEKDYKQKEYDLSLERLNLDKNNKAKELEISEYNAKTNREYKNELSLDRLERTRLQAEEKIQKSKAEEQNRKNIEAFASAYPNFSKKYGENSILNIGNMLQNEILKGNGDKKTIPVDAYFVERFKDSGQVTWDDKGNYYTTPNFYIKTLSIQESELAKENKKIEDSFNEAKKAKIPNKIDFKNSNTKSVFNTNNQDITRREFDLSKIDKKAWE